MIFTKLDDIPRNRYKTIIMDVPWPVNATLSSKIYRVKSMTYDLMDIDVIKSIPVASFASENCILFFWTTHRFLPDSFDILKSYGFSYHGTISWYKHDGLTHLGFYRGTEFCLVGYRGRWAEALDCAGEPLKSFIDEPSRGHSIKPASLDRIILKKTRGPRLDMFARMQKPGFDSFGDQVMSFDTLEQYMA